MYRRICILVAIFLLTVCFICFCDYSNKNMQQRSNIQLNKTAMSINPERNSIYKYNSLKSSYYYIYGIVNCNHDFIEGYLDKYEYTKSSLDKYYFVKNTTNNNYMDGIQNKYVCTENTTNKTEIEEDIANNILLKDWRIIERKDNYNNELQSYCKDNVILDNGKIKIISEYNTSQQKKYTSGMVESNKGFLYGYFEFDIEISSGKGIFPAIWMMPCVDKSYPEVDIFEMVGDKPDVFYGVIHYENKKKKKSRDFFEKTVKEKNSYRIAFRWDEDNIIWYIDDEEVFRTNKYVPDEFMYIIINQAIGGNWPGNPDASTVFPSTFIIKNIVIEAVSEKER